WLDPLPDVYLDSYSANPESQVEARESLKLAFLVALQKLPGRQRAILILRDVLGWKAQEVADLLNLSVTAVNSAVQRARTTLKKQQETPAAPTVSTADDKVSDLLARYVHAWETADSATLVALLREDAILTMPPLPAWYRGRAAIRAFLDGHLFGRPLHWKSRLVATRANDSPAFAVYEQDEAGAYQPVALQIVTTAGDRIARIDDFLALDRRLFSRFRFPPVS
ncbi:MAG TPA: RNA polymerase subunit sigma-70, partial [Aggregatilineales bacterium]|nr:RNA polymerase subunit sigma-70 [Aggregatilineales bacterium]